MRNVIETDRIGPKKHKLKQKKIDGAVNSLKIKTVCTSEPGSTNSLGKVGCNNGWMSALDNSVKPILTPLILGQTTLLNEERQRTLATWITMKVMVLESGGTLVSTAGDRAFVMQHGIPPTTWKIWIGRQDGQAWKVGYMRKSAALGTFNELGRPVISLANPVAKNTQLVTLGMGYMFFHVFSSRSPLTFSLIDYPDKVALFRVHPYGGGFFWPPRKVVGSANIDMLSANFDRLLDGLPWSRGF